MTGEFAQQNSKLLGSMDQLQGLAKEPEEVTPKKHGKGKKKMSSNYSFTPIGPIFMAMSSDFPIVRVCKNSNS